ncbi:MAG: hypothetical protein ABI180_04350 [Microcoleus sp.]
MSISLHQFRRTRGRAIGLTADRAASQQRFDRHLAVLGSWPGLGSPTENR